MDNAEAAYLNGQNAYDDGQAIEDCPYHARTRQWLEWRAGWADSQQDDQQRYADAPSELDEEAAEHIATIARR